MDELYSEASSSSHANINALLLTATFDVTVETVRGDADLNATHPESQLLKHIIAVQNTSALAKNEAKNFNAGNGQEFADSKKDDDGGDCQTVVNARLKPIVKAWSDIYSELTDKTEDAPPTETYSALDKCLDEYWAAIQEVTKGVKNNVGDFTRKSVKEVMEENLKQFKTAGPEFVKVVGPSVDSKKLSSWVDKTYGYLNDGIKASS